MGQQKKTVEQRASFRFAAVSIVLAKVGSGMSMGCAIFESIEIMKLAPVVFSISRSSLYRWIKSYERFGFKGLTESPVDRESTALSEKFLTFMSKEKKLDQHASIPEIIRRARALNILNEEERVNRTTAYRHARRLNLPLPKKKKQDSTKRPFAYPHRMQMVLCDGKHFRAGPERLKRVAYFFIDDATRYILSVIVGTSENSSLFLRGLYQAIAAHGLFDSLYLDKGPGFIAADAAQVAAKLGIPFIFGATRYPQGHGKVERFNQTCKSQCLRGLAKPGINPGTEALKNRLDHFCTHSYGETIHEELKQSPADRFLNDTRPLRFPSSKADLKKCFVLKATRKVTEHNTIPFDGITYEVPFGYASTRVEVYEDLLAGDYSILHEGSLVRLAPPDLAANARDTHRRRRKPKKPPRATPVTTAAEIQFNNDVRPIVDADFGFESSRDERTE